MPDQMGPQTTRDQTNAQDSDSENIKKEIQVSSDEDELEPPRSASVPIAKWVEESVPDDDEDEIPIQTTGGWELTMKRDFNTEITTYL